MYCIVQEQHYSVYKITSHIFNEWSGRIAGLIYALYMQVLLSSVLTNQHLAVFLFYLGFYLLVTKGLSHKYMWIFIGISLSLGDIMRPLGSYHFDCSNYLYLFTRYVRKIKTRHFQFY